MTVYASALAFGVCGDGDKGSRTGTLSAKFVGLGLNEIEDFCCLDLIHVS